MSDTVRRLFDIPYFIQRKFGNEHAVFVHNTPQGVEAVYSAQYLQKSDSFTSYLLNHGLQKGARVITVIGNSPEYNFAEAGILQAGGVHIPLSALYNSQQLKNILEIVQPEFVVTSSGSLFNRLRSIAADLSLSPVIINTKTESVFDYPYAEKQVEERKAGVLSDDTAVILFTSGSTGNPKGVVLSHTNILESVKDFSKADIFHGCKRNISFLQLSQSGERKVNYSCQLNGITICYPLSSKNILDNILFYEADITAFVPYLLKELGEQIQNRGLHSLSLRKIICGGASAPINLISSFERARVKIFEVYGLTETASLLSYNTEENYNPGSVGQIASTMQVAFSEAKEILVKGENIMQGYLLKGGGLQKARDANGWFHTGDAGNLDKDGFLKITGRIKNAFKNSRGSYVYPEEIEFELMKDSPFEQVIILGENADSLSAVLKLSTGIAPNENSKFKINSVFRKFNEGKNEEMKITKYLILDNNNSEGLNLVSMKIDRNRIEEKIKTDSLINFISVE